MPLKKLVNTLKGSGGNRCADGCETTRALFAAAIERELQGEPPDADLYARLDRCPACAQAYIAALDLAFQVDREDVRAADVAPVSLPRALRSQPRADETSGLRRVAEDSPPYGESDE